MDLLDIARYLGALLLVLGLIGFAGLAARRFGLPGLSKPASARRLKIVETLMISPRQRLVLLRRDGVEHLVMISPDGASVIEASIAAPPAEPPA
jgi:flagellar protein FliO/FliZ